MYNYKFTKSLTGDDLVIKNFDYSNVILMNPFEHVDPQFITMLKYIKHINSNYIVACVIPGNDDNIIRDTSIILQNISMIDFVLIVNNSDLYLKVLLTCKCSDNNLNIKYSNFDQYHHDTFLLKTIIKPHINEITKITDLYFKYPGNLLFDMNNYSSTKLIKK